MPNAKPLDAALDRMSDTPARPPALTPAPPPGPPRRRLSWRQRLRWYRNRLACMSPGEIVHRLGRAAAVRWESLFIDRRPASPPADLSRPARPWLAPPPGLPAAPWLLAAAPLLGGHMALFARPELDLGMPPDWNRDPKTGIRAPLTFGKRLDYRDPALVGDIKYLWELNRHGHLVTLAQAWALAHDERHAVAIGRHLASWFEQCPPGLGVNWASSLEAGLRLINWSAAWQLLGGSAAPLFTGGGEALRRRWLDSVYQHCRFIHGFHSRHSSANNHLIGEAAGLYIAAVTWPCWPEAAAWRDDARRILEEETLRQITPDGVDREQSSAYQLFVLELLLLPWLAGRANGFAFSGDYRDRLLAMLDFVAALLDAGGHLPMIGDGDDGVVLRLAAVDQPADRGRAALARGAVLFGRADWKARAGALDAGTPWLVADAAALWHALPAVPPAPPRRDFPEGGYYILGSDFASPAEIRLVADAGPLGYGGIAAHGHADALSFTLALGGEEFLIDPGTYAYHDNDLWRAYFRGTSAHNTARVDGLDQSTAGGNFMWLHKARAGVRKWQSNPEEDLFEGWHDGYLRLPDPVQHIRRIVLDKPARRILIEDRFAMAGTHDIELFFHCAEDCAVTHDHDGYLLRQGGRQLRLSLPRAPGSTQATLRGSLQPPAGWISRRYDERLPTTTIRWAARLSGTQRLYTRLLC